MMKQGAVAGEETGLGWTGLDPASRKLQAGRTGSSRVQRRAVQCSAVQSRCSPSAAQSWCKLQPQTWGGGGRAHLQGTTETRQREGRPRPAVQWWKYWVHPSYASFLSFQYLLEVLKGMDATAQV